MNDPELLQRIQRRATDSPRAVAYVEAHGDQRWIDYSTLAQRVCETGARLRESLRPGSVVMLRCANRIEYPIWYLAILAGKCEVFPVSVELTDAETRELAGRADVSVIAAGDQLEPYSANGLVSTQEGQSPQSSMLLASSGTTGTPKIVRRSARSLDAVARNMVEAIGFSARDRVLASVPLSHSYGVEHGLLAPMWAGSTVILCDGLDLPVIARTLRDDVTIFPAVPSMIEMLASVADDSLKFNHLRLAYSAGGPLPHAVYERFDHRFTLRVGQLYGMTEIGSATFSNPDSPDFDPTSVGRAMSDVSIRISGDGEVLVRAPSMLSGYVGDGAGLIDGHFPTGDVGRLNEHDILTITGRVRLLIDAGGMKINPIEVESVLSGHPDVIECVVIPVRQSETVQRLCAVIVPRDHAKPPTLESIRSFAKQRLAAYKVPRLVQYRDALPRNATGKILRQQLETT